MCVCVRVWLVNHVTFEKMPTFFTACSFLTFVFYNSICHYGVYWLDKSIDELSTRIVVCVYICKYAEISEKVEVVICDSVWFWILIIYVINFCLQQVLQEGKERLIISEKVSIFLQVNIYIILFFHVLMCIIHTLQFQTSR